MECEVRKPDCKGSRRSVIREIVDQASVDQALQRFRDEREVRDGSVVIRTGRVQRYFFSIGVITACLKEEGKMPEDRERHDSGGEGLDEG